MPIRGAQLENPLQISSVKAPTNGLSLVGPNGLATSGKLTTGLLVLDPPAGTGFGVPPAILIGSASNRLDANQPALVAHINNWAWNFNYNGQGEYYLNVAAVTVGGDAVLNRWYHTFTNRPGVVFEAKNEAYIQPKHSFVFLHSSRGNDKVTLGVQAQPNQTGAIQEWMDSAGVVRASVTPSGEFRSADSNNNAWFRHLTNDNYRLKLPNSGSVELYSGVADGAASVAIRLAAAAALATAGAKILSIGHSAGSSYAEKAYVDKDGSVFAGVGSGQHLKLGAGEIQNQSNGNTRMVLNAGTSPHIQILSGEGDGATAVAVRIASHADYVTAGAKLLSIGDNAGAAYAEKAFIDKDGVGSFGTSRVNLGGSKAEVGGSKTNSGMERGGSGELILYSNAGNTALTLTTSTAAFVGDVTLAAQKTLLLGVFSDANRPAAGTAGRVIFNTTDGNLNIDNGTNWTLPDGTVT